MDDPIRTLDWPPPPDPATPDPIVSREWLVANGLGGYASGTVSGVITRRYHGLLIAALPAPLGRVVMLSHLAEQVRWPDGRRTDFGGRERSGADPSAREAGRAGAAGAAGETEFGRLVSFRLEAGLPVWRYDVDGALVEKRLFLTHMQNTVRVFYTLLDGPDQFELALRPSVNFRVQEAPVSEALAWPYEFRSVGDLHEIALKGSPLPPLRVMVSGERATVVLRNKRISNVLYPLEESRGYEARGDLWSPGYYRITLRRGDTATFTASTEPFETAMALDAEQARAAEISRRRRLLAQAVPEARSGLPAELVLAADQFLIAPAGRIEEAARARASGDEVRTVIAGYHWFTDWGRDTMISLEGLTLTTGRLAEAGYILRTFAHYVRDGLIPNMFPEGEKEGLYHTADATLWFFHAIDRYLEATGDDLTLATLYPILTRIVRAHVAGTRFGIHVDPQDGLLTQGASGYQLTWMDAKVDDWVVTPRRGKAVEINALWHNALRLMDRWASHMHDPAVGEYGERAAQAAESFNERFWCADRGYLYDVVDAEERGGGPDPKCRPNQVLAISLPNPVLRRDRWERVMGVVREQLVTPVGLRSLAPDDPDYKATYRGDLRARDAAYHQGTVWGWLVGPFVDAWLKVYPHDIEGARRAVAGFLPHLNQACVGSVSEIFDADAPFTPRGCIAQAWSVAELLRVSVKIARLDAGIGR